MSTDENTYINQKFGVSGKFVRGKKLNFALYSMFTNTVALKPQTSLIAHSIISSWTTKLISAL